MTAGELNAGRGPVRGVCAVCGDTIGSYDSRWFSDAGQMVCAFKYSRTMGQGVPCRTEANAAEFRHYWTGG
jgi:hypothetical protein